MNYLGIEYNFKNRPKLDKDYIPFGVWSEAYLEGATRPVKIGIERNGGYVSVFETYIRDDEYHEANLRYIERLVKFLLWSIGGMRIYLCGCDKEAAILQKAYTPSGDRSFEVDFMNQVFENGLSVHIVDEEHFPASNEHPIKIGGHLNGCRIGFDAGGSDRKVSAVIDGTCVYSEEVVWSPKLQDNPEYHYDGIMSAFRTAASKMPRVDGIGVSTAGVVVDNQPRVASLFIKVPAERHDEVKNIYLKAAKEMGDLPIVVVNDGDVTALAGSMSLDDNAVMGIAMGTSEAVGYVDKTGRILGWFNELAFAPVDLYEKAPADDWSGDIGCGSRYFSQEAVIRLAANAGIEIDQMLSRGEQLKVVQKLMNEGNTAAEEIFKSIGVYLAHTIKLYSKFYDIKHLIILGRVTSGAGGDTILAECQRVMTEEYPELSRIEVTLPDEKMRRLGQSVAAASLVDF